MTEKSNTAADVELRADRTHGSEAKAPRLTIAATEAGNETLYLGKLTSTEGRVAYLRIWQAGYRILFQNRSGTWKPDGFGDTHSAAIGNRDHVFNCLEAVGFTPDDYSKAIIANLPRDPGVAYGAIVGSRAPLRYIPADLALAREAVPGQNLIRGY